MRLAVLLCLASLVAAGEPDGAVADALRWTCARGCASQSGLSTARPVVGEVEEAWALAFGTVQTPPVHWHGVGYLAADDALIGFDLQTGAILARMKLSFRPQRIVVWNGTVILGRGAGYDGYVIKGKKFYRVWRHGDGAAQAGGPPAVQDNEVYTYTKDEMMRLRVGSRFPVWTVRADGLLGVPAVYGDTVFVARRWSNTIEIAHFDRRDGRWDAWPVAKTSLMTEDGDDEIAVTHRAIFVRSVQRLLARGTEGHYAVIPVVRTSGSVKPRGEIEVRDLLLQPQGHRAGMIIAVPWKRTRTDKWAIERPDRKLYELADSDEQRALFSNMVPLAVMGNVAYFGGFAADVESREIFWKLPHERIWFGIVPADGLLLVVDGEATLHAYREAR